jgi:predicted DNA-binding ribbon-helix-helix protein
MNSEGRLKVRSFLIEGRQTTIALEPIFWDLAVEMCKHQKMTMLQLVHSIENERCDYPRTAAMRVHILKYYASAAQQRHLLT